MDDIVFCPCPYHDPEPSDEGKTMEINGLKGVFLCHACGVGGVLKPLAHSGRYVAMVPDYLPSDPVDSVAEVEALSYVRQWPADSAGA